jgi:hypothetical protein
MKSSLERVKKLQDFSTSEVVKFNEMHCMLTEYNARLGTDDEMPMPEYSDDEMAEYSGYRQMVIAKECEDW